MKLYRGDNIYNKETEPYLYRNNGLLTKAFGSNCNPDNIELQGLLESIRKHVKPENSSDKGYYNVTDFLSFSESKERALFWCSDMDRYILEKADEYKETRYLFNLSIDNNRLKKFESGMYLYNFCCNPKLKSSDSGKEPHLTAFKDNCCQEICSRCNNINENHSILLINSYEYLIKNTTHSKYTKAINFASNDKEWLILPFDPLGIHRSSRIPRADFWDVELYKVIGERRPLLNGL